MDENKRLLKSWAHIELWLCNNCPESLDNLLPPAPEAQLRAAESIMELQIPGALKALLSIHNGEACHNSLTVLPNGHRLLTISAIVQTWKRLKTRYIAQPDQEQALIQWRNQINQNEISILGPVKPQYGCDKWLPISVSNSRTVRFIDFDPPEGGTIGQVVEADPIRNNYQVLATSFINYIEQYAMDLVVNKYIVNEDFIQLEKPLDNALSWDIPNYLKEVKFQYYDPEEKSDHPTEAQMESGERLMILGEMSSLMGEDEILFSIETEQAKEYTFLAKPGLTKNFSSIAINQHARVLAKAFHGEIKSKFIEQGLTNKPDFIALEYTMLRTSENNAEKIKLRRSLPAENIDLLAQNILNSVQSKVQDHHEYREVKPDKQSQLHSKFYFNTTESLLKLGFHFIGDLKDQAVTNKKPDSQKLFRTMSYFDDGIVACFFQNKSKMPWPFHSDNKVIEFETQFSDGNIIISTNAAEKVEHPLPKCVAHFHHPSDIPVQGLLYKHRGKIRRHLSKHPESKIIKVRNLDEFALLRNHRFQMIYDHLLSVGWVTKEYLAKQFNNKKIAEQVHNKIREIANN